MDETLYKNVEDADRGIMFADRVAGFAPAYTPGRVLHILCVSGGMSFTLNDVRYNVGPHDYVILPDAALASDFTESADAAATVMSLSEEFVTSLALRSNYGIIGHLSLLQNPVMRLTDGDFATCREALDTLGGAWPTAADTSFATRCWAICSWRTYSTYMTFTRAGCASAT